MYSLYSDATNDADTNTLFNIASTSKSFTAALVALLVEEGKLDWNTPVKNYLPNFQLMDTLASDRVNMIDLLAHRTGLPRHEMATLTGAAKNRYEYVMSLKYAQPVLDFRSAMSYNNHMYTTAGYIAGQVSGEGTFENAIQNKIFNRLNMTSTKPAYNESLKLQNYAYGHACASKLQDEYCNNTYVLPRVPVAYVRNLSCNL